MPRSSNIITIRHPVEPQLLADIMHIACSDSIDAWADIIVFTQTEDPAMYKMEIIELAEEEENNHHTITGSTILLGMQRIIDLELPPPIPNNEITTTSQIRAWIITSISDGDATMIDAYCADAIIQYALFNEQVYS
jgi:hypothetical protein